MFIFVSGQVTVADTVGHGNEASVCIRGEEFHNPRSYSWLLKMDFALEVMECSCYIFCICLDLAEIHCYLTNQHPYKPLYSD
jgi:hypothetical protein